MPSCKPHRFPLMLFAQPNLHVGVQSRAYQDSSMACSESLMASSCVSHLLTIESVQQQTGVSWPASMPLPPCTQDSVNDALFMSARDVEDARLADARLEEEAAAARRALAAGESTAAEREVGLQGRLRLCINGCSGAALPARQVARPSACPVHTCLIPVSACHCRVESTSPPRCISRVSARGPGPCQL